MNNFAPLAAALAAAAIAGCATTDDAGPRAEARLSPTRGNAAAGVVTFVQAGDTVRVTAEVSGLPPGPHGFHVHEKGDCSAPDATSAGGHFNPGGHPHGHPDQPERHAGDLPQLVADADGVAKLSAETSVLSVGGGAGDVVGRAVIVHAAADDFKTQPTGNSGARVACGVVAAR